MELSIPYELVGPDGQRAVFGNSDDAQADVDYVGWLDPETGGVTGLDGPETIERYQQIVGGSGAIHFDFLHGRRPIGADVVLDPNLGQLATVANEERLKAITNAMDADAELRWQNTGLPMRRLLLRRQQKPTFTGRRPKVAHLAMVCSDFRISGDVVKETPEVASGVSVEAINDGSETASPVFTLTGPYNASTIKIRNLTTGLDLVFKSSYTLAAGQVLTVDLDPPWPTILEAGAIDRYGKVDFLNTTWWGLIPGYNLLRAEPAGSGAGRFKASWRDAWI